MADRRRTKANTGNSRNRNRKRRGAPFRYYVLILSVLSLLIVLAFFTPQVIFQVQDAILCKGNVLSQQENVNVESLSTTYEQSLGTRMTNYAEGLAGDDTFYVASQNLSDNDELSNYFYSDSCIHSDYVTGLVNANLLPMDLWEMEYSVSQWKQYVIYSDNFTKGVNFILWYIELQDSADRVIKLLADAEDGTIYAIRTEGNVVPQEGKDRRMSRDYSYLDEAGLNDSAVVELWGFYALYYRAIDEDEIKDFYALVNELGWEGVTLVGIGDAAVNEEEETVAKEREMVIKALGIDERWQPILEKVKYHMEGDDGIVFSMPYGDFSLEAVMDVPVIEDVPWDMYIYPNLTIGIRQIYEMIPEFA